MSITQKVIRYSVGPFGAALISLITIPLIAWLYTVDDVAKFSIFQSVVILYSLVFCLGLDQAFIREYYEANNKELLLKNILWAALLPSFFFILITSFFFQKDLIFFLYDEYSIQLFILTILTCFFSLCVKLLGALQRVKEQALLFSLSQLLPKIIFLLLILVFYVINLIEFKYILLSQFLSIFFVFIYFLWINVSDLKKIIGLKVDFLNIKNYYIFGFPLILTGVVVWGLKLADRFYLKIFSDLNQLGLYAMAVSVASGVAIFSSVFNTIWSPLVYKWVNEKSIYDEFVSKKVSDVSYKISISIFVIMILLVIVSRLIVMALPSFYYNIYLIIPLCALAPLLYTLSEVTGIGINLMKKTKYTLFSCIVAIVFHILFSFFLIPKYGSIGAAVASAISFYIFFIIRTLFSNHVWVKCEFKKTFVFSFLSFCCSLVPLFYGWYSI